MVRGERIKFEEGGGGDRSLIYLMERGSGVEEGKGGDQKWSNPEVMGGGGGD